MKAVNCCPKVGWVRAWNDLGDVASNLWAEVTEEGTWPPRGTECHQPCATSSVPRLCGHRQCCRCQPSVCGDSQAFSDLSLPPQHVFCSLALSDPALWYPHQDSVLSLEYRVLQLQIHTCIPDCYSPLCLASITVQNCTVTYI